VAKGGQLTYSLVSGIFLLLPEVAGRVALDTPETRGFCDRVENAADGTVRAIGKVSGTLQRQAPLGSAGVPTSYAADSVVVPPSNDHVSLVGEARIWQGNRLIRADRIDLEQATEVLTGQGGVLTSGQQTEGNPAEVVVRARQLRYDRRASEAVYEGDVIFDDSQGQASCQRLVVSLGANGEVRVASLDGGVTIRQRGTGRVLTGQRAGLDVASDLFEMWGSPVLVQEPKGNQVKADHLRWLRRTNTIVVLGKDDSPSETLFKPERTPKSTPRPLVIKPARRPR
jgi:lipopolysaccharide export system protein LptA